jgi:hypothetical protein
VAALTDVTMEPEGRKVGGHGNRRSPVVKKYLTVHGHGQGVLWWYIYADSAQAIELVFEGLTIYETPPSFWTDQAEKQTNSYRLGDPIEDKALLQLRREN